MDIRNSFVQPVFLCCRVLVVASYDHVLPPPEAKGNQHIYFPCFPLEAALSIINFRLLFNTFNAKLNTICHFLALLRVHHILHVSRVRDKNNFVEGIQRKMPSMSRCKLSKYIDSGKILSVVE